MSCCTRPNRPSGVKWWGLFDAPFQEAGWRGERGRVARKKRGAEAPGQREIFFVPRTRLFFLPRQAKLQRSYRVATGHTPCFSTGSDAAGAPPLSISTPNVIQERSVLLIAKSAASGWCARVGYTARSGAGYDHAMSSQRRSTAPLRSWRARPDTLGGRCKTGVFPTL